jgi:hypothetical protein
MLIWKGLGILVPIITFATIFIAKVITDGIFGKGASNASLLPKIFACLVCSCIFWFIGNAVNRNDEGYSFFFIQIQYWAFVMPIIFLMFGLFS